MFKKYTKKHNFQYDFERNQTSADPVQWQVIMHNEGSNWTKIRKRQNFIIFQKFDNM